MLSVSARCGLLIQYPAGKGSRSAAYTKEGDDAICIISICHYSCHVIQRRKTLIKVACSNSSDTMQLRHQRRKRAFLRSLIAFLLHG
jgi:hypothetical protein